MASQTEEITTTGQQLNHEILSVRPKEKMERKSHCNKGSDMRNFGTRPESAQTFRTPSLEKALRAKVNSTQFQQSEVLSVRPKEKAGRRSYSDFQRKSAIKKTATIPEVSKNKTSQRRWVGSDVQEACQRPRLEHAKTTLSQRPSLKQNETRLNERPWAEHKETKLNQRPGSKHANNYLRRQYPAALINHSKPQALHYHDLVKLRETKSDMELLQERCKPDSGFEQLLNTKRGDMDDNVIECLLDVLVDLSSCDNLGSRTNIIQVMTDVRNSTFLQTHLSQYYMKIMVHKDPLRYLKPINNSIKLFKKLIELQPSSVREIIIAQTTLERVVITTHETTHFKFPAETIQEVAELQRECEQLIGKDNNQCKIKHDQFSHKRYYDMADDDVSPPDNFRNVSILPTIDELKLKERPSLRPNIEVGRYKDLDHYLDVQFRLLKEDFVHPLREGISTYRDMRSTGDLKRRLYDIRIYHNVIILDSVCALNGINHNISFDVFKLKHVKWTKRLVHGSFLCLSKDNFENVHFATVSNSTPENLKRGRLEIQFTHQFEDGDLANYGYVMVESTALFEAYRHVLKGLQKVGADLPFQKYLIDCIREIEPPNYMLENQNITFNIPFPLERHINLMDDKSWPTYQELKLDLPQYLALKEALRNEMAIIQGPPGTGKTFIGLKIMQCLLKNECLWKSPKDKDSSPIIVVCLTNHALDQFLEGILKHMSDDQKLIRVGSRSKSEMLNSKKLGEYKERMRRNNSTPKRYYYNRSEASEQKTDYEEKLGYAQWELKQSKDEFMNEDVLQRYISKEHLEALHGQYSDYIYNESGYFKQDDKCSVLLTWLGFVDIVESLITNVSDDNDRSCTDTSDNESEDESINTDGDVLTESDDDDDADVDEDDDDTDEDDEATIEKKKCTLDMYAKVSDTERKTQRNIKQNEEVAEEIQWQYQEKERQRRKRNFKINIRNGGAMTDREVASLGNICDLEMPDRWRLYRHWVRRYQELKKNIIIMYKAFYERACRWHKLALENEDRYVMGTAAIIGMTTNGAAKYRRVLAQLRPKIVIVEEAAEVLEAQIITCLSSACEHLILIGDHKQLQPNPTVYELAERFKLKVSLFERLINNEIPCVTLETQHRMRPEISIFMKHIYPELKDSESVKGMENVKGVSKNVFFINHSYVEDHDEELTSKSNLHEVKFIKALCRYLLQQGYKPEQITILTGYTGQVLLFKNNLPKERFEGVRISAIDNFQGEENDIILMSLVRSNQKRSVGFLKVDNRVCVSMSRAKKGLFVIGNFDMLRRCCTLWENIIKTAEDTRVFGSALPLHCQNHPEDGGLEVKDYTDFARAPEGGCTKPCQTRLNCGHQCTLKCHPFDQDHLEFRCKKPCPKMTCDKNHRECKRMCYQECDVCEELVEKIIPGCEHVQMVPCCIDPSNFNCTTPCPKMTCNKNHNQCNRMCYQECEVCGELVEKIIPGCEHVQMVPCCVIPLLFDCTTPCPKMTCDKNHKQCQRLCHEKCDVCEEMVEKIIPGCKHVQMVPCNIDPRHFNCTTPCQKMTCDKNHKQCQRLCHEECDVCEELVDKIILGCKHVQMVPCNIDPCYLICTTPCPKMTCDKNHKQCQRLCHEECDVCEELVEKIIPGCKHVQTVPCYVIPQNFNCTTPCPKMTCNKSHKQCQRLCHEECDRCEELVEKIIPGCKHVQIVPCYLHPCRFKCSHLVYKTLQCKHAIKKMECYQEPTIFMCTKKCDAILDCGHECSGTCGECLQGKVHKACRRPYIDNMICGHTSEGLCMESQYGIQASDDFPLKIKLSTEKFGLCQKKCLWKCKHLKCTKKCSDPCSRVRCNFPCEKKLSCGHQCAGLCGEKCPSLCVVCNPEEMRKIHHQYDHQNTRFIELIACKHIFEVTTLDKYMEDAEMGLVRKIKLKACPKCQTPIKGDFRYGNVTKPIIKDIAVILKEHHNQIVAHTGTLQEKLIKMQDKAEKLISILKLVNVILVLKLPIIGDAFNLKHGIVSLLQWIKEPSYSNQVLNEIYCEGMRLQILFELIQIAIMREKLPKKVFPGMGETLYKRAIELKELICNTKFTPEVMKTYGRIFNSLKLTIGYEVPKEVLIMKYPSPKDQNCRFWYRCNQGHTFYDESENHPNRCPKVEEHIHNHGNQQNTSRNKKKKRRVKKK